MKATKSPRKPAAKAPIARDESSVERMYLELRDRAMRYDFKPGSRINEKQLGEQLGVARATLREALNRLVAEGLLEFVMNKGFFRKAISVNEVFDQYQVRIALERRAVLLAVQRAPDEEIAAVKAYWVDVMRRSGQLATADLVLAVEDFHRRLVALSQNKELTSFMDIVTRRIHVARHVDIEQLSSWNLQAFDAHMSVIDHIAQRNADEALKVLSEHIDISLKRAVEITKEMVALFFLADGAASLQAAEQADRRLQEQLTA